MAPQITSVVTAATAAAKNFIDLATVKSALKVRDGSEDAFLNFLISWASDEIVKYCNRVFAVETITDEWLPHWGNAYILRGEPKPLQLSRWPIVASGVSSVVEDGVALVDGTDYRVEYKLGQLFRIDASGLQRCWSDHLAVTVTYSAGFNPMEPSIVDAALRMITARRAARGRDPGLKQESIPGVREAQWWIATGAEAGNITPDIADILDSYRVPVIA